MVASHLAAEAKFNSNRFGLTVVTGRHKPPPAAAATALAGNGKDAAASARREFLQELRARQDEQDDANWGQAAPTWSCLALALGAAGPAGGDVATALEPTRRALENFRSRLASMWDIPGLWTTDDWGEENADGQPLCTSHYGFLMTDFYLVYALSGQQTNIPEGTLSFAPLYACPFSLPFGMLNVEGTVSCDATTGAFTLAVAFGSLVLPAGGLSVNNLPYPGTVSLSGGQSVSWGGSGGGGNSAAGGDAMVGYIAGGSAVGLGLLLAGAALFVRHRGGEAHLEGSAAAEGGYVAVSAISSVN
jgi:hypothetical protein